MYPVEIPSLKRWAVFQSTTDTLFIPTWHEDDGGELCAHMFTRHYAGRPDRDFSEAAQMVFSAALHSFVVAHQLLKGSSDVPAIWLASWESDYRYSRTPEIADCYDLVGAFERDWPASYLLMDEFYAWAQVHAPLEVTK